MSDNMALVQIINKQSSKDKTLYEINEASRVNKFGMHQNVISTIIRLPLFSFNLKILPLINFKVVQFSRTTDVHINLKWNSHILSCKTELKKMSFLSLLNPAWPCLFLECFVVVENFGFWIIHSLQVGNRLKIN